jgi:hypothetical protein
MDSEIEMNLFASMEPLVGMFGTAELLDVPLKLGPVASKFTTVFPLATIWVGPAKPHCRQAGGANGRILSACAGTGAASSPAVTTVVAPAKSGQRFEWVIELPS